MRRNVTLFLATFGLLCMVFIDAFAEPHSCTKVGAVEYWPGYCIVVSKTKSTSDPAGRRWPQGGKHAAC